jgi:hypothetical protein
MSWGTRVAVAVLGLYVVEAIVVKATASNGADGDASIVIGGFATAFGAVVLGLALQSDYVAAVRLRGRLRHGAEPAPAKVAAVVSFHGSDFSYPVFEYATPDGVTHRHADASSRSLAVGAEAVVRYQADDPDHAVGPLGGFHAVVFGVLAALGVLFAVIMPVLTVQAIIS